MKTEQIVKFCPEAKPYADALIDACARFSISDVHEQAVFLAQVAHESGGFRHMHELWGPTEAQKKYDARIDLGNTKPEAIAAAAARSVPVGRFFAGHGAIQITGYYNHRLYSRYMYKDDRCVADPEMLTRAPDCILSAAWFWTAHACGRLAAPGTMAAFEAVTRRINGGLTGLESRVEWWERAQVALGIGDP